jgi:hypothetical protein
MLDMDKGTLELMINDKRKNKPFKHPNLTRGEFYFDACLFFKGDTLRILRPDAPPLSETFSKIAVKENDYLRMGGEDSAGSEKEEEKSICFFTKHKKQESKNYHKEIL